MSGLLGTRVLESSAMPGDMVLLVRNGQELQRFIWTANTLAEQEVEIEKLRAEVERLTQDRDRAYELVNDAEAERDAALRERDEARENEESAKGAARDHFAAYEFSCKEHSEARAESTSLRARVEEAATLLREEFNPRGNDEWDRRVAAWLASSGPKEGA